MQFIEIKNHIIEAVRPDPQRSRERRTVSAVKANVSRVVIDRVWSSVNMPTRNQVEEEADEIDLF